MTSGRGFPGQRTSKKLMLRVRPGVELVRASLVSTRVLITLDFPTFDRPRNATSGRLGAGKWSAPVADARNRAITLILQCERGERNWQGLRGKLGPAKLFTQGERLMLVRGTDIRSVNLVRP